MGSAVRMGRRNLFSGRLNGSRTAQILPESPGRQRPTTETADAACEEVIETPGAMAKPGCLLRRPMRRQTPSGLSAKTKIRIAQLRFYQSIKTRPCEVRGESIAAASNFKLIAP